MFGFLITPWEALWLLCYRMLEQLGLCSPFVRLQRCRQISEYGSFCTTACDLESVCRWGGQGPPTAAAPDGRNVCCVWCTHGGMWMCTALNLLGLCAYSYLWVVS